MYTWRVTQVSTIEASQEAQALRRTLAGAFTERPLLMVVPGSGLVARCAVESGADALMVLNAGTYRTQGTGSLASFLPFGNANAQTEALLQRHVLPRAAGLPVVAGVLASDPSEPLESRLRRLKKMGVAGVVNWPAVGFIDGQFRQALEAEGLGAASEAEMLSMAKELGLVAFGFALGTTEVEHFMRADVDALILDIGLTRASGDVRTKHDELHQAIARLNQLSEAAVSRPNCVKLAFGGPIVTPEDLNEVLRHSSIQGFAGGSVFERLPVRDIVNATLRRFKGMAMRHRSDAPGAFGGIIGGSPAMLRVFDVVQRVAAQDVTVCIEGESGTGKELVAGLLHRLSPRANHPFVTLNCGAIPDTLLESELFGHERGAFTGAERQRPGKFELAHGGTLFLDEIADLSTRGQVALLRVLQQREVTRVGGELTVPVDVRILTASNRPLSSLVEAGEFRSDLFYRLCAINIQLPRLSERPEDMPLLVEAILSDLRGRLNRDITGLSADFERKLMQHDWPGNVRELEQVIHRCAILEDGSTLAGWSFEPWSEDRTKSATRHLSPSHNHQRAVTAVQKARGNKSQAAKDLQVTRRTLYRWLREAENSSRDR
ncbi:phosphoenolpyruvate hydrolase family protein [Fuerstiella marisgermanici]|uniref:phosphoenolpyruvate hydrolase family protein n=1 Tax=Fuerstiella marisgermanici TaxID=1891926 RepID=UPI001C54E4C9|nr:phosphoenolpyruvate hydrolase family protein [Fuerstiella marisgermanici]